MWGLTNLADYMGDFTGLINEYDNIPGLTSELRLFKEKSTPSTTILIDRETQKLSVIPEQRRGAPAKKQTARTQDTIALTIPQIAETFEMSADELQDRRAPGETGPKTGDVEFRKKVDDLRGEIAVTLEFMQMGALKGTLIGGSGATIYDYYSTFGVTKKASTWALSDAGTEVATEIYDMKRYVENNHKTNKMITGYTVLCSPEFMDALVKNASFKEAFSAYKSVQEPLRNDVRNRLYFQGVTFMEYGNSVNLADGTTQRLIEPNKAHVVPMGLDIFETWYAPDVAQKYANTMGKPFYLKTAERDKWGTGIEALGTSYPLPICTRPQCLIELTAS